MIDFDNPVGSPDDVNTLVVLLFAGHKGPGLL